MNFAIALEQRPDGTIRAHAPDLPGCETQGDTHASVLPTLRLAMEARITALLLAGTPLPPTRDGRPPAPVAAGGPVRWVTIHLNVAHLAALAAHQRSREPRQGAID